MTSRSSKSTVSVRLEAWSPGDFLLLTRLNADPAMMHHLGGAESPQKIAERHARYLRRDPDIGLMFRIVDEESEKAVGNVGYWPRAWRGAEVYETGWMVLPEFQGRGIAGAATAQLIDMVRSRHDRRYLHAFPSVGNRPSNAICRKLGFTLLEAIDFEYPAGHLMRCNDWRLDLLER